MSGGQMPDHRWCLGKRRVCGDKISCPPRQLNGGCIETALDSKKGKGKVFPYSLPSVGPGADPGVQALSPQVT